MKTEEKKRLLNLARHDSVEAAVDGEKINYQYEKSLNVRVELTMLRVALSSG